MGLGAWGGPAYFPSRTLEDTVSPDVTYVNVIVPFCLGKCATVDLGVLAFLYVDSFYTPV